MTQPGLHVPACVLAGLLLLLAARPAIGQVISGALSFEVASVKVSTSAPGDPINSIRGGPGTSDPELIVYRAIPFETLLARVFDIVYEFRMERPDWMRRQLYDITAKVPVGATKEQANQMLLNLLKERFHLKLHHETRQVGGYEFSVAKGGSKLKESPEPDAPPAPPYSSHVKHIENRFPQVEPGYSTLASQINNGHMFATARSVPVSYLFSLAFQGLGELPSKTPFVDQTGLIGKYDADIMFAVPSRSPDADPPGGPGVVEVFEKQLGLRVEKKRITIDVIVVDSADKIPSEN